MKIKMLEDTRSHQTNGQVLDLLKDHEYDVEDELAQVLVERMMVAVPVNDSPLEGRDNTNVSDGE